VWTEIVVCYIVTLGDKTRRSGWSVTGVGKLYSRRARLSVQMFCLVAIFFVEFCSERKQNTAAKYGVTMYWILGLLITYMQDSELQVITAPSLISTHLTNH
jgi:hypothetical protein